MQNYFFDFIARTNPVLLTVAGVFLGIVGVLVIVFPQILAWTLGIGIILLGVALFTSVFLAPRE